MNLQLNLSLTLLYDSKSPDRGDDGGDVQRNSRNNDSLHSEILRWELHSIDTIVTLITP